MFWTIKAWEPPFYMHKCVDSHPLQPVVNEGRQSGERRGHSSIILWLRPSALWLVERRSQSEEAVFLTSFLPPAPVPPLLSCIVFVLAVISLLCTSLAAVLNEFLISVNSATVLIRLIVFPLTVPPRSRQPRAGKKRKQRDRQIFGQKGRSGGKDGSKRWLQLGFTLSNIYL